MTGQMQFRVGPLISALIDTQTPVVLYLTNGVKLEGGIVSMDDDYILIGRSTKNGTQLEIILRHALGSIVIKNLPYATTETS